MRALGSKTIDGATYTVDNAGNRTAKTDWQANVTSSYGYDQIYELLSTTQGGTTTESYTYDPVGNRLSSLGLSPYQYNVSNELTQTPNTIYAQDANSNTTLKTDSSGSTTYAWDYENRLTSVTLPNSGGVVTFKYDPFGRRIQKSFTQPGNPPTTTTTNYAYDRANIIDEVDASGNVVAKYAQGQGIDEPLAMLRGGAASYYQADGLGSVTSLTNGAGTLAQTYTFDSFGKQTASNGSLTNPFRYTAREFDTETNLYHYRARYYDPPSGRFVSEDPAKFGAGVNFFAYVHNEPIDFVDPYGLKCRQVTPWQEIPTMSAPGSLQPFMTVEQGLYWSLDSWDFANGPEGGTVISCECTWIAAHTRIRKFYRQNVQEEAWFECGDCGGPQQLVRETRTKTKEWHTDTPGAPIMVPEFTFTSGPAVQIGRDSGADPSGLSTKCLCPPPTP